MKYVKSINPPMIRRLIILLLIVGCDKIDKKEVNNSYLEFLLNQLRKTQKSAHIVAEEVTNPL